MAGHRRGEPLKAEQRVNNRKAWHTARIAEARGPLDRVHAAMEGVRAALKLLAPDRAGELADLVVERASQVMHDAYTDALNERRKPDDRRH